MADLLDKSMLANDLASVVDRQIIRRGGAQDETARDAALFDIESIIREDLDSSSAFRTTTPVQFKTELQVDVDKLLIRHCPDIKKTVAENDGLAMIRQIKILRNRDNMRHYILNLVSQNRPTRCSSNTRMSDPYLNAISPNP